MSYKPTQSTCDPSWRNPSNLPHWQQPSAQRSADRTSRVCSTKALQGICQHLLRGWLSPHPSAQITPAPEYTAGISPSSACSRTTVTLSSFEFLLVCTSYTVYNKVKPIAYGSAQADFPYKHGIRSSAKEVNNKYSHFFTIHILERSKRDSWYRCGARLGEDEEFGKAMGQQLLHAIPLSSQGKVELCTLR